MDDFGMWLGRLLYGLMAAVVVLAGALAVLVILIILGVL